MVVEMQQVERLVDAYRYLDKARGKLGNTELEVRLKGAIISLMQGIERELKG